SSSRCATASELKPTATASAKIANPNRLYRHLLVIFTSDREHPSSPPDLQNRSGAGPVFLRNGMPCCSCRAANYISEAERDFSSGLVLPRSCSCWPHRGRASNRLRPPQVTNRARHAAAATLAACAHTVVSLLLRNPSPLPLPGSFRIGIRLSATLQILDSKSSCFRRSRHGNQADRGGRRGHYGQWHCSRVRQRRL